VSRASLFWRFRESSKGEEGDERPGEAGTGESDPSFLGKVTSTLAYGDRVETLEEKDGWIRIVPPGGKAPGWIHSSALTEKRVVLKAGKKEADVAASTGELALAGKGFNAEVERHSRRKTKTSISPGSTGCRT